MKPSLVAGSLLAIVAAERASRMLDEPIGSIGPVIMLGPDPRFRRAPAPPTPVTLITAPAPPVNPFHDHERLRLAEMKRRRQIERQAKGMRP